MLAELQGTLLALELEGGESADAPQAEGAKQQIEAVIARREQRLADRREQLKQEAAGLRKRTITEEIRRIDARTRSMAVSGAGGN